MRATAPPRPVDRPQLNSEQPRAQRADQPRQAQNPSSAHQPQGTTRNRGTRGPPQHQPWPAASNAAAISLLCLMSGEAAVAASTFAAGRTAVSLVIAASSHHGCVSLLAGGSWKGMVRAGAGQRNHSGCRVTSSLTHHLCCQCAYTQSSILAPQSKLVWAQADRSYCLAPALPATPQVQAHTGDLGQPQAARTRCCGPATWPGTAAQAFQSS